ncbi:MAG: BatA domain-containing protein [Polaribacter sp.]|jgi:hypothetical protein
MYFKNPDVLYFLFLLIIPILVHLFQLQKFVKTPFTNVAFLKKIKLETRKSANIKKWLILAIRMLSFLSILLSFSQPYLGSKNTNKKQDIFIYLDNSLSLNTKGKRGDLLKIATQDIIKFAPTDRRYTLQTNNNYYTNIDYNNLKNQLLSLKNTSKTTTINTVIFKKTANQKKKTKTSNKNILISDFQNTYSFQFTNVTPLFSTVILQSSVKENLSIDSLYFKDKNFENTTIAVNIKNEGKAKKNIPIAIYSKKQLISKQIFSIKKNETKTVLFNCKDKELILGKIKITYNDTFKFDNTFYFSQNKKEKIKVLSIGNYSNFLPKIYSDDKFNYQNKNLKNVNYNKISNQDLIILNELKVIPNTLINRLISFSNKGGNIVIIPNKNSEIANYNSFLNKLGKISLKAKIEDTLNITSINFSHPIFKNVFLKKIENFQYPKVNSYFPISSNNEKGILSFQNTLSFVTQINNITGNIFLFSSSLSKNNSNFLKSPLIVPLFYNFGTISKKTSKLYYRLDKEHEIDVSVKLNKEGVVSLKGRDLNIIPSQKSYQSKISIEIKDHLTNAGFYHVTYKKDTLQSLAFNNPKSESNLQFFDPNTLKNPENKIKDKSSIKEAFSEIDKKNKVQWLWKWFLALAIVSLLLEILILKFYKP